MTLNEMTDAIIEMQKHKFGINRFVGDYAAFFNISQTEAHRISERSNSVDDFFAIYENSVWWTDEANDE
jgi:hypothetical protein|tara:strand:+ start:1016 stop:1222 length:207 start_codon:yes stop_codon:yes gene_type:complete